MVAIRNILTRLGKRSGLSSDRLRKTEIDVSPLLDQLVVRQYAHRKGLSREEAVVPVVREQARQLPPSHRLIVDVALRLGLLSDDPPAGIDPGQLYAAELGKRREYLTDQWETLHEALGVNSGPEPPNVRRLRGSPEHDAFTALADLLAASGRVPGSLRGPGALVITEPRGIEIPLDPFVKSRAAPKTPVLPSGVVTVIGDAVLDHIYNTDKMPRAGVSTDGTFHVSPGGKGLNRAVAAARLGLQVRLLTAVGNDPAGRWIIDFLRASRVDVGLVQEREFAPTTVAAMIVTPNGAKHIISCQDDRVGLNRDDLHIEAIASAIRESDVVLMTFEQPRAVLQEVSRIIREAPIRPKLLVLPAPSVDRPQHLYQYLDTVDYVIGTWKELADLVPETDAEGNSLGDKESRTKRDLDSDIAPRLLQLGVRNVCAVEEFECRVRSDLGKIDIPRPPNLALDDSPGSGAAFSAALAYRLLLNRRPADAEDFRWAALAMTKTQSLGDVAGAMPSTLDVDLLARQPPNGVAPEER